MQGHLKFGAANNSTDQQLGELFHPAVAAWFENTFSVATEVQRQAWQVTAGQSPALIAAPTGSGKTLAAFLSAINDLVEEGLSQGLDDSVHVLYISPLKALSNDIQKNLQAPLEGIRERLIEGGYGDVPIRDAVRTGDTTNTERAAMRRKPPHILVTTPESLFILLTSDSGRQMLSTVRSVIVDELHAVAGCKRGAHLMLSLERLAALCEKPPLRIGLSATQKPIEDMAAFLMGGGDSFPLPPGEGQGEGELSDRAPLTPTLSHRERGQCSIVDTGHTRDRDLAIQVPGSPLSAVMANEVWAEIYDKLAEYSETHRTTLVFVNQRRVAERVARHLAERIGEEFVTAHHGSLAKEHRLDAEQRLKAGKLKVLIATASLELGIDIGDIDLVCQLGSPRGIAAFLQRVGRAGHAVDAIPKGRLFPLSLDELVECTALLDSVNRGELDRIPIPDKPLDVLAQQMIAEVACREWDVDALFDLLTSAMPYRDLKKSDYLEVLEMLAEGYATRRGRRGAYIHYDQVNGLLRGRKGAKLTAVTNAGTIPDQFDYDVVLLPESLPIGSLNEDFAFESLPGDIFQLGNTSYRMLKVETGKVFVEDAKGAPPNIPFWFGEAPGRTDELSQAVSRLRADFEAILVNAPHPDPLPEGEGGRTLHEAVQDQKGTSPLPAGGEGQGEGGRLEACEAWLRDDLNLSQAASHQLTQYLASAHAALGCLPTQDRIVFERFFDETGDTHLVVHAPFGSRINRAWGLALRKKFCRQFNFELQASALEDSLVLSLGPTHSFPLDEPVSYVKTATLDKTLEQAILQAPMFPTRWRWVASVSLAIKRSMGGKRIIPQFQRMDAEDLLTVVFPDAVACQDNLPGEREVPDHPLIRQALHDCLHEVMDVEGLRSLLTRLEAGEIEVVCRDLTAPSPLSEAILNARPYAFLDDGAAEERRTQAVRSRGNYDPIAAGDLGKIDPAAIDRVRGEVAPEPGDADELHDALVVHGFLSEAERQHWQRLFDELLRQKRATVVVQGKLRLWVATEALAALLAVLPDAVTEHEVPRLGEAPDPDTALQALLRGRLDMLGPVTEQALADSLGITEFRIHSAITALQAEGYVMRGAYTQPDADEVCERRLLARIHRYTRDRKRADIEPVSPALFMRHLFDWHGLHEDGRREGQAGLLAVLAQLEGFPVAASAWEKDILPLRVKRYLPDMLDKLCSSGQVVWQRPAGPVVEDDKPKSGPVKSTPILLCAREQMHFWRGDALTQLPALSSRAQRVYDALKTHGAAFLLDLTQDTSMLRIEVEQALAEMVSHGLVTADSFAGLRALVAPSDKKQGYGRRRRRAMVDINAAGRWSLVRHRAEAVDQESPEGALADPRVEHIARVLLQRYGIVFRRLLDRESGMPPWRELYYVYRRMEARDEIRGGRFVSGFAGEQFALPEAVAAMKQLKRSESRELAEGRTDERMVTISAADPFNLLGSVLPGARVPAIPSNRILFRGGVPVALQVGGEVRFLAKVAEAQQWDWRNRLIRQARPSSYLSQATPPQ